MKRKMEQGSSGVGGSSRALSGSGRGTYSRLHAPLSTQVSSMIVAVAGLVMLLHLSSSDLQAQGKTGRTLQLMTPRVFVLDAKQLAETRTRILAGDKIFAAAINKLESDAKQALETGPFSVVTKQITPPSGDKHDYMSQAPYFWADPKSPNGLPYIRRDGERNLEINKITDHRSLDQLVASTETLALAYYFQGDETYAAKAVQLLRAFFLDPATRMNPNLQFAQGIPGINTGRGIGLIETRGLTRVVDTIGLLAGSKALTKTDQQGLEEWYSRFLRWMMESKNGRDEAAAKNNHGTYYDVQVVSFALFLGRKELATDVLLAARQKRIALQIEPDGRQPLELVRTKAWGYSIGNLDGLMQLARLGGNVGVDLWNYKTADGRSIRRALDYLVPFAFGEKKWPHQQLGEWPPEMLFPLLRRAANKYEDRQFADATTKVPKVDAADRSRLLMASSDRGSSPTVKEGQSSSFSVAKFDRARVLKAANQYLSEMPMTITAAQSPRSAGGLHDFFSEGDYWWPDPNNPSGPYIQRDGMTNPDNFVEHRRYLMRLSVQVPALVAAWKLTKDPRYAKHAVRHLRAWFIDSATLMNPNLQYAQAIHGRFTGRGIGVIDTIHLVEVARAIEVLQSWTALSPGDLKGVKLWFRYYVEWMTNSKNGLEEREAKNNHGTCWVMQVAAFASLTGNQQLLDYCRDRFKTVLVPNQIAADGSFPQELRRTKPYGYSLFNLDAMTTVAQILSSPDDNLWIFALPDGRGIARAMEYMAPYIKDKKRWPLKPDAMYDAEWPMRHSSLLFAGQALSKPEYVSLWKSLKADSSVDEVIRNFFIRQPVLWTN